MRLEDNVFGTEYTKKTDLVKGRVRTDCGRPVEASVEFPMELLRDYRKRRKDKTSINEQRNWSEIK